MSHVIPYEFSDVITVSVFRVEQGTNRKMSERSPGTTHKVERTFAVTGAAAVPCEDEASAYSGVRKLERKDSLKKAVHTGIMLNYHHEESHEALYVLSESM